MIAFILRSYGWSTQRKAFGVLGPPVRSQVHPGNSLKHSILQFHWHMLSAMEATLKITFGILKFTGVASKLDSGFS